MALSLTLNTAQKRLKRPRLGVFAQGAYPAEGGDHVSGWSAQFLDHVWQEPVGKNLILAPVCLDDEWLTTFSGAYSRLGFADFGLTEGSGGWRKGGLNQARMANDNGTSSAVISTSTFGGDRGFYFSYSVIDAGTGDGIDYEIGYGTSGSANDPACRLALQIYKGGRVFVNRDGKPAGQGSIGPRPQNFQEIIVLPLNLREVLIFSLSNNAGFIFTADEVAESDPTPRIVPDTKFWFYRPSGTVDVEVAPLRFATAGSAASTKLAFADLPADTETAETPVAFRRVDQGGTVTASLVDIAGDPYVPSTATLDPNPALENGCRLKVALTGPGTHTPTVQAAVGGYPAIVKQTPSDPLELRERALSVRLSVPESPTDVRTSFSCMGREVGTDDALWDLTRLTNLPLEMSLGALAPFFQGQSQPTPETEFSSDRARLLEASFRDEWALLENARYRDPYPFDGLTLTNALQKALKHARGPLVEMDIEDNSFVLPLVEGAALGQWAEIARATDPSCDVLRHMLETYASTWLYGYFPRDTGGPIFRAGALETHFGSTPVVTLYASITDAVELGGYDPDPSSMSENAAWRYVYHDWHSTKLRVEANDIRVTGWDPKRRRVLQSRYTDAASADPETPIEDRPDNWEGEWLPLMVVDPRVTTQAAADRACGILATRTSKRREIGEFSCELARKPLEEGLGQPLWKGAVVELFGKGLWRIGSLEAEWIVSEPDGREWGNPRRRCRARYAVTKGAGSALGLSAVEPGLAEIKAAHDRALANRTRVRPGGEFLLNRPVAVQSLATLITA